MAKKKSTKSREDVIIEKAMNSKAFLYIHGFLTDSENKRVFKRIIRRVDRKQPKKGDQ